MTAGSLLSWMLCGLVVGLVARLLVPGRQHMSLLLTMALGVVGAVVGGFVFSLVQGGPGEPFSLSGNACTAESWRSSGASSWCGPTASCTRAGGGSNGVPRHDAGCGAHVRGTQ